MRKYKVALFFFVLFFPQIVLAGIDTYYVTQDGAGAKNGSSIENAWSIDDFNNSSRWSKVDNASMIDPGDTINLSGTFTKNFIPRGSGTENSSIVIDGHDAKILTNVQQFPKIFDIKNVQYLVLQSLFINGQDSTMTSTGERSAIWVREFGAPTGHITIQDSIIEGSASAIILQGNVSKVYIYRNTISNMSNNGVVVAADNYDGDDKDWYDDCPSYIVIGGSSQNGNTFVNIGKLSADEWVNYDAGIRGGAVPGNTLGTFAKDLIFSYNHVYATMSDVGAGIYLNGVKRILIEYNTIHNLASLNHRSYITFKNDNWFFTEDIIIRFNKIYDVYDGPNQYAAPGDAIRVSGEGRNRIVYGNYCEGAGINLNWNWGVDNDGVGGDGYFIWGNIINGTASGGGISINGTSLNKDRFKNFYIYNNTIYRAVQNHDSGAYFYAICTASPGTTSITETISVKNNLVVNTRPSASEYVNISMNYQDDMIIDYNHHETTGQTAQVRFEGSDCNPGAWNSEKLPTGYGSHDTSGDPKFRNAGSGDFALLDNSPCKDSGENLSKNDSVLPAITIQGKIYNSSFSAVLDPIRTDWSTTPPTVVTVDQNSYGGWEKGAYVFVDDQPSGPTAPTNLKIN
ncbi:MAG: hypothetical protein KAQ81_15705 [Deltaproteobacteria bacterium]|nr:hypothetical protein [Deltaproteobacteria bacterium]